MTDDRDDNDSDSLMSDTRSLTETEVRAILLSAMRDILLANPTGLSVTISSSVLDKSVFGDDIGAWPTLVFFGPHSYDNLEVDTEGGFKVTMSFGEPASWSVVEVPARAIGAWSYGGARVTLPANLTASESDMSEQERAAVRSERSAAVRSAMRIVKSEKPEN